MREGCVQASESSSEGTMIGGSEGTMIGGSEGTMIGGNTTGSLSIHRMAPLTAYASRLRRSSEIFI